MIGARQARLLTLRSDPRLLAASRVYYAGHFADFIDDWMWTYNPRLLPKPANIPMVLWPRQREYVAWLDERLATKTGGLVEKSREVGVSYLNLAYALCLWLFAPGAKVAFGSRKEALVDRAGDPDSIFEKGRLMLRMLPDLYLPAGYLERRDATYMKFINQETGATITGEAGDNIGRGGRNTVYFVDEAAHLQHPMLIDAALSQNTDIRIDTGTPNGNGNPFYRKRHSGEVPVFTFHWRDDPRKNDAWYAEQKRLYDPVIVAAEIDIDYNASTENVCIPSTWVQAAVGLKLAKTGLLRGALDVADEGGDLNVFLSGQGVVVEKLTSWAEGTTTQTARKAYNLSFEHGIRDLLYDVIGVGSGVKGEMAELERDDALEEIDLAADAATERHRELEAALAKAGKRLTAHPVNVGSRKLPGDFAPGRKNADTFLNYRAQLWWCLRRRFMRTWEHVTGVKKWPEDELIALPTPAECPEVTELIAELSRPKYRFADGGKIQIESKAEMRRRGVKSPNHADTLSIWFGRMKPRRRVHAV